MRHLATSSILRLCLVSSLLIACEKDDGTTDTDTRQDTTADSTDTSDASDTGTDVVTKRAPTLTSVKANVQGPQGLDLRVTVIGEDADKDIDRIRLRLFDAAGQPLIAFRSGLSDTPDTHETALSFDIQSDVTNKASILATATLRNLFATYDPASVEVALIDAAQLASPFVAAEVEAQTVNNIGEACDPAYSASRCAPGLGCRESQCQEGLAPEVTKVAYLNGQGGTRILVSGTEPEDDIDSLLIEFLDLQGNSVTIDLDNDSVPESTNFVLDAQSSSVDGKFFVRLDPSAEFEAQVKQIAVTARDLSDHEGAKKTAKLSASPVRSAGQGCDPLGYDTCNATSVCLAGATGTTWSCRDVNSVRKTECNAANVLLTDGTPIVGFASGASLFNPPTGCSAGDSTGRPEGLARLTLSAPAAKLTITTNLGRTAFDTVLYLVPACGETTAAPLGCADETPNVSAAATLELELVPAGTYLVVIDSWGPDGGEYELSATVE